MLIWGMEQGEGENIARKRETETKIQKHKSM